MIAQFPINLDLPQGSKAHLTDAAAAVKKEFRASVQWKKLRCRKVTQHPRSETIFVLEIGKLIEFDWTWEGAIAFRPRNVKEFQGNLDLGQTEHDGESPEPAFVWVGEVVEVDETNGRIYVSVIDPSRPPKTGSFFVRPFEFLACLNRIYSEPHGLGRTLAERLRACKGSIHPQLAAEPTHFLPQLQKLWRHSWGVLWGPAGTGKTWNIGQHLARCLNDPDERILVVSTTNKATDEVARSSERRSRNFRRKTSKRAESFASARVPTTVPLKQTAWNRSFDGRRRKHCCVSAK
jgi:hypothetical protein